MKNHKLLLLFFSIILSGSVSFSAVQTKTENEKLLEELTGKKQVKNEVKKAPVVSKKAIVSAPLSKRHLDAGFYAFTQKNYILALKHYNAIIVKYPKSNEVRSARLAKAKLYQEMGLKEQAQLNLKLANEKTQITK